MSDLLDELSEEGPEAGAGLGVEDAATTLALARVRGGSSKAHDVAAEGFLADQRALMAEQRRHLGAQLIILQAAASSDARARQWARPFRRRNGADTPVRGIDLRRGQRYLKIFRDISVA
jgi:hypothetical protein